MRTRPHELAADVAATWSALPASKFCSLAAWCPPAAAEAPQYTCTVLWVAFHLGLPREEVNRETYFMPKHEAREHVLRSIILCCHQHVIMPSTHVSPAVPLQRTSPTVPSVWRYTPRPFHHSMGEGAWCGSCPLQGGSSAPSKPGT